MRKPSRVSPLDAYPHIYDAEYGTIRGCACGKRIMQQYKTGETTDAFSRRKTEFLNLHKACAVSDIGQGKPPPKE